MLTSAAGTPVTPPDPAARPWQEGAGAAGLHGLTVCDAAWGCVMWGRRHDVMQVLEDHGLAAFDASWQEPGDQLAAQLKGPPTREASRE